MKLCIDCKHYEKVNKANRCVHNAAITTSIITGETVHGESCEFMRLNPRGPCGMAGKLWESKIAPSS